MTNCLSLYTQLLDWVKMSEWNSNSADYSAAHSCAANKVQQPFRKWFCSFNPFCNQKIIKNAKLRQKLTVKWQKTASHCLLSQLCWGNWDNTTALYDLSHTFSISDFVSKTCRKVKEDLFQDFLTNVLCQERKFIVIILSTWYVS